MKLIQSLIAMALLLLSAIPGHAAITIPGADGSDGALNITDDTIIDLSQAVTGVWNANNTANAGKGIYDPAKWAVVFKYSSVTVASGKTLTFTNHPSHAPVVWLVSGNATISGTVSLNGTTGVAAPSLAEPGPGGFRGGMGIYGLSVFGSAGFGVGGGGIPGNDGYGGSYGSAGGLGPVAYGNPSLIPLIGGSGGSGTNNNSGNQPSGGGAGGGAILIACGNTLTIGGQVGANGGAGASPYYRAGSGSGGGVRLVADTLAGTGIVNAVGGSAPSGYAGGLGRIRIERVNNSSSASVLPDPSIVPLSPGDTALLWPPSGAPDVRIVSIGGQNIGPDPLASFGTFGADAALPQTASTQLVIETTNVEQASQVKVRGTPRSNASFTEVNAAVSSVVSTTPLVVRWTATLPVQLGYAAVQVKVIRP